jgi:ABC-type transport system substrate-binding protein
VVAAPAPVSGKTPLPVATATPAPKTAPVVAAAPVVDRLKVALVSERESNDPILMVLVFHQQVWPMYENLHRFDETGNYAPMLATSWEISPDLKTWTYNLRKGVQWHKGFGEFTAKDVVHTIQRHVRPESVTADITFWKALVEKGTIEVVDDYKLVYHLPVARLNTTFYNSNARWNVILSKAHFDAQGQAGVEANPVGTGPYQYVKREQGAYILYERVPYKHYRVTPDFKELQIFFVKEHATRLAMLLAGEAHMTALPSDLEPTAVNGGMKVLSARIPTVPLYTMFGGNFHPNPAGTRKGVNPDLPYSDVFHPATEVPWLHRKVREALNRAVNRDEIQATILAGKGESMPVSFYHSSLPGWNPQWKERYKEKYGYDPKRAKELLAEVEKETGKPLDWSKVVFLLTIRPELPQLADIGEAVNNYWKAIGANVKLEEREFAWFVQRIIPGSVGGVAWTDATIRFEDPSMLETIYYSGRSPAGGRCCHFFERDTIDTLYEKLAPETDFAKRDQYLREAGNYIFEEYATLPLYWLYADFTVNPKVIADYPTSGQFGLRDLEYVVPVRK